MSQTGTFTGTFTLAQEDATFTPKSTRYRVERNLARGSVFDATENRPITVSLNIEQAEAVAQALNDLEETS